jgi:archaellum component FlaC
MRKYRRRNKQVEEVESNEVEVETAKGPEEKTKESVIADPMERYKICENCGSNKITIDTGKAHCQNCANAVVVEE